jgi:hypothetical protein
MGGETTAVGRRADDDEDDHGDQPGEQQQRENPPENVPSTGMAIEPLPTVPKEHLSLPLPTSSLGGRLRAR